MNRFENPELFEKLDLNGRKTPGTCTLSGFKRSVDWDVKQGGGIDGASTTRKGKAPASGTVSLHLVDFPGQPSQLDEWRSYSAMLQQAQDKGEALPAYHPDLADLKITELVITEIGQLEHDANGGDRVSFGVMEYRPPKPKPAAKPKSKAGGAGGAGGAGATDPNIAAKLELEALKAQALVADNL